MTTVEILFRYSGQPSETAAFALSNTREVYGIRRLSFDRAASTLLVEYDATRLNAAVVTQLVRRSGLELIEEVPAPEPIALAEAPATTAPVVDTKPTQSVNPSAQPLPAPKTPPVAPPPGAPPSPAPLP